MLMSNGNDGYNAISNFVPNRVRKTIQDMKPEPVFVCRPEIGLIRQIIDRSDNERAKGVCSNRTAGEVPEKRLPELLLSFGQDFYGKACHSALMRARASAHGEAETEPARSMSLRRSNSVRQASATDAPSLASRLSIKAATTAERSSEESWSAS
jgi:hypothetical protein